MQRCPAPSFSGHTIGDAIQFIPKLQGALASCNADKAALREYVKRTREDHGSRHHP